MRACVIGAGLSGLAAARTLRAAGIEVVVFEKRSLSGGRISTTRIEDYVFDMGATIMAPRGKSLEKVMLEELSTDELIRVDLPIYVHESLRCSAGDVRRETPTRYAYRSGNELLPQMLAVDLGIRFDTEVTSFSKKPDGQFDVKDETFDAVIVTIPAPDALQLLQASGEWRPLGSVYYRPCLSIALGYEQELPPVKYHALIDPEQRHPLTWLSLESLKSPGRAPEGCSALVAQMSPQFSASHFASDEAKVVELVADYVERLYGEPWAIPTLSKVVRWKYSQPEAIASFDMVNRVGSKVIVAGDALIGSRTEHAYESGVRAAQMLLSQT